MESHGLTVLAELAGHAGGAAAGAGGGVAGAPVLAATGHAAVPAEGAGRASWGDRERRGSDGRRSPRTAAASGIPEPGGEELIPPASLTLVAEDAGPARRTVAAGALRVARAPVLAVLAGQAAVGAEGVLQADCKERHCP